MSHRLRFLLLGLGALGPAAPRSADLSDFRRSATAEKLVAAFVTLGLLWILAGLIAWWKRPGNRPGALMTAAGFRSSAVASRAWDASLPSTVFSITDRLLPRGRGAPVPRVSARAALLDESSACSWHRLRAIVLLVAGIGVSSSWVPKTNFGDSPRNLLLVHDDRGLADAIEFAADLVWPLLLRGRRRPARPIAGNGERTCSPRACSRAAGAACSSLVLVARPVDPLAELRDVGRCIVLLWAFVVAGGSCRSRFSPASCARGYTAPPSPIWSWSSARRRRPRRSAMRSRARSATSRSSSHSGSPADERYVDPDGNALDPRKRARACGHGARARRKARCRPRARPVAPGRPRARGGGGRGGEPRARELAPAG